MIYYDGKIYRNLEEQVLKNQKDIEIYSAGGNFDLKGIVDEFEDLPESPEQGDYYLVGPEAPYDLFLCYNNSWVNLGPYPKEGPQGPQGIAGENGATGPRGPQGPKGDSLVYEILDIVASTSDLPDPDSVDYWDAYLVGSGIPYMAYFVINGVWTPVGYITPQEAENVVTADSANASSYKVMMSAQSGTRKIAESAWGITSTVVDTPNLIPSSQAVVDYVQNQVSAAVRFKGTVTFAQLSALAAAAVGDLYNISDSFTLSGVSYDAGTNLVCVTAFSSAITPSDTYWDAYGEAAMDLSPYMKSYTADATQWDTTPTALSTKPVTSGGIKSAMDTALADKQDKILYNSTLNVGNVCLYEKDEDPESDGTDGMLENISGDLYFNGSAVGGGGGGGIQNTATGTGAFAISPDDSATATGNNGIAIGKSAKSQNSNSIAIGNSAKATQECSVAIGYNLNNNMSDTIMIGRNHNSGYYNQVLIGYACNAGNPNNGAIAIGSNCNAGTSSMAIGLNLNMAATGSSNNVAIGKQISASKGYGVAIGIGLNKTIDHDYAVVFNRCKFIPMTKSDSYTLSSTMHGMTLTSAGVTYYAPSSTVTTGSSESALLICWYTD